METRFGTLEQAQNKLKELYNKDYSSNDNNTTNDFWNRLSDYTSKFSPSQLNYVVKSKEVIEADKKMKDAFMVFLFEKFKSSFASIEAFKPICNEYIDTVLKVGGNFEQYSKDMENENAELKSRLAELEKQVKENARPNSKRT